MGLSLLGLIMEPDFIRVLPLGFNVDSVEVGGGVCFLGECLAEELARSGIENKDDEESILFGM